MNHHKKKEPEEMSKKPIHCPYCRSVAKWRHSKKLFEDHHWFCLGCRTKIFRKTEKEKHLSIADSETWAK